MDIQKIDPEIARLIDVEEKRQENNIELIASENFVSPAVMEAAGSCLTNKYAEGYPHHRYYGGCEVVDEVEELAIERAKELFGAEHANVQPHSGSQANMAVYFAFVEEGDTILGMDLAHGGHLTHGNPVSISGKYFHAVHYGVDRQTEQIDFDQLRDQAREHEPSLIIAGASAYPREIDFDRFREVADEVGAYLMVDMAHIAGLVAVDLHPNPVPVADFITSTTHKTLRSTRGGLILCREEYAKAIDKAVFPGLQGGPLMHIIAAKAVGFKESLRPGFAEYQRQIVANARCLAEELTSMGFRLVAGGTDTHLMLVDLTDAGITGKEAEELLGRVGITVNKNTIPFETQSPVVTSGIRIGTPAVTTRGMEEDEMKKIASFIERAIASRDQPEAIASLAEEVREFCAGFPLHVPFESGN